MHAALSAQRKEFGYWRMISVHQLCSGEHRRDRIAALMVLSSPVIRTGGVKAEIPILPNHGPAQPSNTVMDGVLL